MRVDAFAHRQQIVVAFLALALWGCGDRGGDRAAEAKPVDSDRLEQLRALGYVEVGSPLPAGVEVGVSTYDRQRAQPGLNLYTNAKDCSTKIIDMEGTEVHSWSHTPCYRWENTVLLPDGDLLVPERLEPKSGSRYLMRAAWDGSVVWSRPYDVHHDAEMTPDGRILALTHRMRSLPEIHPTIPVRDHVLMLLTGDGDPVEERSLWDLLHTAPDIFTVEPRPPRSFEDTTEIDIFHSNSVEWMRHPGLRGKDPIYGPNTVLISIRNQDTVVIVDWAAARLLWAWGRGEVIGPHDATMLPDGHILLFDNGLGREWSRVVELDPLERKIVWEYRASDPKSFYTPSRGANQRLANGNTLITESDSGRAFEVTRDGEIVWEFINPDVTAAREPGVIVRMRRLEGLDQTALLERLRSGEPLPLVD